MILKQRTPRQAQAGFTLVLTLLSLILLAIIASLKLEESIREHRTQSAINEAKNLDTLKTAANKLLFDALISVQDGTPIVRNSALRPGSSVQIIPILDNGELTWQPTVENLRELGYLPSTWQQSTSSLNTGAYLMSVQRQPPGCSGAACYLEGMLWINQPITEGGGAVNSWVLGSMLNHLGAEAGTSLPQGIGGATQNGEMVFGHPGNLSPAAPGAPSALPSPTLTHMRNRVPGSPVGVIAVRLGSTTSGFEELVRMNDPRDINFRANLTVAGTITAASGVNVGRDPFDPNAPCVNIGAQGTIDIGCTGQLNAKNGTFTDRTGAVTQIDPNQLSTSGQVIAAAGIAAQSLTLPEAQEGARCTLQAGTGAQYAGLQGGGLAICQAGKWLALNRLRSAGQPCPAGEGEGTSALDPADKQALVCLRGTYMRVAAFHSNFALISTQELRFESDPISVTKPVCSDPRGSNPDPALTPQALIVLNVENESLPIQADATLSGINRYAVDSGPAWTVHLERSSDNATLPGLILASLYCYYP
jgi:hypothetical protein